MCKRCEDQPFGRVGGYQQDLVHASRLPDSVDAARPLFEPGWTPWQFEVNDDSAAVLKVQTFCRCIGSEQERALFVKVSLCDRSFGADHAAMECVEVRKGGEEGALKTSQRVAILGKYNDWFFDA